MLRLTLKVDFPFLSFFSLFFSRHEAASAGRKELRVTVNFHANPPTEWLNDDRHYPLMGVSSRGVEVLKKGVAEA